MFLYLPKHFDQNEWFIVIGLFLSILLVRLPKRIPTEVSYLIVLLSLAIPNIIDHSIAAISPYDAYRINDSEKYELFDVLLSGVYVPFGYLCVYFYEWLRPKKMMTVLYILSWDLFAIFFEFVIVRLHVFTYHGWSLSYSFPTYLLVISLFLLYYEFLLFHYKKKGEIRTSL
ncbi:hypothetical protein FB550_1011215 [Neobacillus bataviensis]|uniref:Uncharacterized protein n=1 Tax=Neobacillus bataviensis TaxID=220685 RepID=A0A561E0R0_9BACI|nr:hypothetical protein [Neobacillus bataviensis]TWE09183.1 hypothetical protein FB550_1011215 [Neobacillus bataviensis]